MIGSLVKQEYNVNGILSKADADPSLLTYETDVRGLFLIAEKERMMLLTANKGYLIINRSDIPALIEALENTAEDMGRW